MINENYGVKLTNEDDESLSICRDPNGDGFILKTQGVEWWIDDIHEFAGEVGKLAASDGGTK